MKKKRGKNYHTQKSHKGKKTLSTQQRKKAYQQILRFVFLFIGLLIPFTLLYSLTRDNILYPVSKELVMVTTQMVGKALGLFVSDLEISRQFLRLDNFNVEVVVECTGLYEIFIYLIAVFAYPANFKKKVWGALLGIPFIFLLNVIRMIVIIIISNYHPGLFNFLHLYFWQVSFIILVLLVWLLWIEKVVRSERF